MRLCAGLIATLAFGLALCALLWGARVLSTRLTDAHLARAAGQRLAAIQDGRPLWRWSLRTPEDLIAGHPFGAARAARAGDGVRLTSIDGSAYEAGLRLTQPIDLAHWPILSLHGHAAAAGVVGLIYQASGGMRCTAGQAARIAPGRFALAIDLRVLSWAYPDGTPCAAPAVVTMLRLRPRFPAGSSWSPQALGAWPAPDRPVAAGPTWRLEATSGDLPTPPPRLRTGAPPTPVVVLPPGLRAERALAWRDSILGRWPGALVRPGGRPLTRTVARPGGDALAWAVSALYLAALLGLVATGRRPPTDRRLALELVAMLAGPLWLIAGLQLGAAHPQPAVLAFAAALVYALQAQWRHPGPAWHGLGDLRRGWTAWLPLPAAWLLALVFGHDHWRLPPLHVVLVYLLWAALQQWLLLVVVLRRVQALTASPLLAVLATASVFALLHTPNGTLMQLCLLAECWWAACFLRHRSLVPVAVSHAGAALLLEAGLSGGTLLRSLEVSARFFL